MTVFLHLDILADLSNIWFFLRYFTDAVICVVRNICKVIVGVTGSIYRFYYWKEYRCSMFSENASND